MPDAIPSAADIGTANPQQIRSLQQALRALGYLRAHIDGVFGSGTRAAVAALQHDLLTNGGGSSANDGRAPVAVRDYNQGRVTAVTGGLEDGLAACIADMLQDPGFPQLPYSDDPVSANRAALQTVASLPAETVPTPFLLGVVLQESGGQHFREPAAGDGDSFVVVGLDSNDAAAPYAITSRGYGLGQYTLFHHPPRPEEVSGFIRDPAGNVTRAVRELRDKFDHFVAGPSSTADDRIREVGSGALRLCRYASGDARWMSDCVQCLRSAGTQPIVAGVTAVFQGSQQTYARTQYHPGTYSNVPIRGNIPCDWPYAVRRYNGSGPNSYDYQAETLIKIAGLAQTIATSAGL